MTQIEEIVRQLKEMRIQAHQDMKKARTPSQALKLHGFKDGLDAAVRRVRRIIRKGPA